MAKVTFLVGLCGSGKSTVWNDELRAIGAEYFEGIEHTNDWPRLQQRLREGRDCVVDEISLCFQAYRDRILNEYLSGIPSLEVDWICFENNLEAANRNLESQERRSDGRDVEAQKQLNQRLSANYTIPDVVVPRPIYQTLELR